MSLVLILVLVEDGLGDKWNVGVEPYKQVLILVLVEDGLGVKSKIMDEKQTMVLILVLVEDGLGEGEDDDKEEMEKRS